MSSNVANQGYKQAYEIIQDLHNRLAVQKEEFERKQEADYEEAYAVIKKEQSKNSEVEKNLSDEVERRLKETKDYMIDKVDQFLAFQGEEIYEHAKAQILNDPRMIEHKVTLDKIIDITASYLSDDEYSAVTSAKIEEASKAVGDLRAQVKILEAKNFRLSTENKNLNESVREARGKLLTEGKNERTEKVENASGRGTRKNAEDSLNVIREHSNPAPKKDTNNDDSNLFGENADLLHEMKYLSGLIKEDEENVNN
jgi:regulator of replication initiation timing